MEDEKKQGASRILGRKLAKEVSTEDMKRVVGGANTISWAGGSPGDIDEPPSL